MGRSGRREVTQGLVVVAKSGGDYTTIGAALAAITASESNRYLIKVLPGLYSGMITYGAIRGHRRLGRAEHEDYLYRQRGKL